MARTVAGAWMLPSSDIDLYFGIGFIPDWVRLIGMSAAGNEEIHEWNIHMARLIQTTGGVDIDDDGVITANTFDAGCQIWRGGNAVTSAQATAGNCLTWDTLDYSKAVNHDANTYSDITTWTYVTGQTGYWNTPCNTTYVNAGSFIWIASGNSAPKRYIIDALASNGEESAEVTISETGITSGNILKISNRIDMKTMSSGAILPAGFWIDSTIPILTDTSEIGMFEAGTYDK